LDKLESYCFTSIDPKYVDGNKLLWSEMPSDVSEAVFEEIDWQLSEDVTWAEDVTDWEIVRIEPQAYSDIPLHVRPCRDHTKPPKSERG